jgi:hypothetical protein
MLTLVSHFKKAMHRVWAYFEAHLAFTMPAFNMLVQGHGLQPNMYEQLLENLRGKASEP